MNVYVDTSAFLAIINANDQNHGVAVDAWRQLLDGRRPIVTSNYVVVETIALLHNRHGVPYVRRFVEELLPAVLVEWVDQASHAKATSALLASSGRRGPGLVDCASFEVIRRDGITRVFAYDRHFEERGFSLLDE